MRVGPKMAGGLLGLVIGGGLGNAMREQMIANSPEAALLAKYATGTQDADDAYRLSLLIKDRYKEMGLA